MHKYKEIGKLFNEDTGFRSNCSLCKEARCPVGKNTGYGKVIYKIGNAGNGWFATLSPKTGGNPKSDFTIQLMPSPHLTHFSQMSSYNGLGKNYGISFSKISRAMTAVLMQDGLKADSEKRDMSVPIGIYGKCTTWTEKKEHLHIKIFPFRNNVGQPFTVDSSFEKKEIFKEAGREFVKMSPVKKEMIEANRFNSLAKKLIGFLKK